MRILTPAWFSRRRQPAFRASSTRATIVAVGVLAAAAGAVVAPAADPPPDWVPSLGLSYVDPASGERVECAGPCRRFEVPDGAELELRITVANRGGEPRGDGPPWDLWWDQRLHPFPGLELAACTGPDGTLDIPCWRDLVARVDWETWRALPADLSCVPEAPDACRDLRVRLPLSGAFAGSRGRGVYSLALWVDRFGSTVEADELDNFAGPVRVSVRPAGEAITGAGGGGTAAGEAEHEGLGTLLTGSIGRAFDVAVLTGSLEKDFSLGSQVSRTSLAFAVGHPGRVVVEVGVISGSEEIHVELRKVSTGAVLVHARDRGRIRIAGEVGAELLKDDRLFEVVVSPDQGSRGLRGTLRVSYPTGVRLIADRGEP
jgi:hypothetical protein